MLEKDWQSIVQPPWRIEKVALERYKSSALGEREMIDWTFARFVQLKVSEFQGYHTNWAYYRLGIMSQNTRRGVLYHSVVFPVGRWLSTGFVPS
jgi:hypothetical protein